MAATDLATLQDVKAWLGLTATSSDTVLSGLISAVSGTILGYINRVLVPHTLTELRDGTGTARMLLHDWPVLSISSLILDGSPLALNATPQNGGGGFVFDAPSPYPPGTMANVTLLGGARFSRGVANVLVSYLAGYMVQAEAAVVPASPYAVQAANPYGSFSTDEAVTYADGTALAKVASNPGVGQYAVSQTGLYSFSAADVGQSVLLSYGYTPAAIRQACVEAVSERFRYKDRIGIQSQSLASQETISYSLSDLSKAVRLMLSAYQANVSP